MTRHVGNIFATEIQTELPHRFQISSDAEVSIDIGGTNTKIVILNDSKVEKYQISTDSFENWIQKSDGLYFSKIGICGGGAVKSWCKNMTQTISQSSLFFITLLEFEKVLSQKYRNLR